MLKRNGQNLAEYTIIIAVVIMALAGMELFVKRAFQAKHKNAVETTIQHLRTALGDNSVLAQYDPTAPYSSETEIDVIERTEVSDWTITRHVDDVDGTGSKTTRTGIFEVLPVDPR